MKDRWKILTAVAIILSVFTGIWLVTMHVQPQNEVGAYKKILRDQGEKLEVNEILPPPVPPESNSVIMVQEAFRMLGSSIGSIPYGMTIVAPGKAMVAHMQPEVCGFDFTNSWENFTAEVAGNRSAIELLHQVLERPKLDFQLEYKKGFSLLLPHLSPLKRAEQKLQAAVVCDLHNGDTGAAMTNILTMLGLVQRNEGEGLLISHLVRIAMTAITISPSWELLQSTNVTDGQLAALQQGWEAMNFLSDATNVFVMERACSIKEIQKARASYDEVKKTFGLTTSMSPPASSSGSIWDWPPDWEAITTKPRYAIGAAMWRSSWSYSDELRTLQGESTMLETLRTMQTNQSQFYKADYDAMTVRLSSLGITNAGASFFRALKIPDFSEYFGGLSIVHVVRKIISIETARRIVITAIALKRFQLEYGKLPETLNGLVPQFLSAVLIDPYDGKLLRYRADADGTYLLYSIGEDGVDDGGSTSKFYWQGNKNRDWVWPQPAAAKEIQTYYEEQARKSK